MQRAAQAMAVAGLVMTALAFGGLLAAEAVPPPLRASTPLPRAATPVSPDLQAEWKAQFDGLQEDITKRLGWFKRVAPTAVDEQALILDSDRDPADVVLRRTTALLADLKTLAGAPSLAAEEECLAGLARNIAKPLPADAAARHALYEDVCRLRRSIAFLNPLLRFDRLLFIKRHHPGGVFHMVDQFYGFNARPGGGLYVLIGPFGEHPRLVNLLADAVVQAGRLKGRRLDPGAWLAPEVSWDGRTIYFAYTEAKGGNLEWSPQAGFHLFRVNADGSGLVQLTDGTWNDFDPCELPSGRVVFVSERRGGYLRCGRHCPTYTMFWMAPDGTDIRGFSFHETHEWQPSVDNDGMVAYTRWDYVDRDTNVAHHLWTCYPDGRDPRSYHGNYPKQRASRPWMEMDIRAIPGSRRYVATTGAHHGNAFGSLAIIDPRLEDDGAMSQVRRLTPEAPFPEAEGDPRKLMAYGTAWPLSETYYLCAYDAGATRHGLYLVDKFGNRELIYRDKEIPSISPMPLRPRHRPPLIPAEAGWFAAAQAPSGDGPPQTTASVMNVYDADFAWPPGTRIAALRIIQLLPKTTPPPNLPRIGVADQTNARTVLGTVPVEADGSAHFVIPADRPLYFQALDERGLAVQSMRSVTYAPLGSRLVCQGCHEPKRRAPPSLPPVPLALRRPPSSIRPGPDGSNPFNYVRLVQPVLDRRCVECHRQRGAVDLSREITKEGWTQSYAALAGKYGFYFHVSNGSINRDAHGGSRTPAGRFGARASTLLRYLGREHYDVRLSDEEFGRVILWLDSNSEFLGAYENAPGQARGEVVRPSLE